jgi:hypothetical protein
MAHSKAGFGAVSGAFVAGAVLALVTGLASTPVQAQNYPITPGQQATAEAVAVAGIPLSELAPDAPDTYTVKSGDTLWGISGLFLKSPWRWPELWGMNMEQIRNPHRIYPGQQLHLEKADGLARLRLGPGASGTVPPLQTVRVSPRVRISSMTDTSIPTLPMHVIEPFLQEAIIVAEGELELAPRIVAGAEDRVMFSRGDRAYVRGRNGMPLVERDPRRIDEFRVFRSARPLKDPVTQGVLGWEAAFLGNAELVRSETVQPVQAANGEMVATVVPATIDIVRAKEEMRVGDRLLPEPPRQSMNFVPRAAAADAQGLIVSVYGDAVALAGQNQVIAINRGAADGLEPGHVLALWKTGRRLDDRSQPEERAAIKLPDERNGLVMVFRTFDHLSYALILEIADIVQVGDRVGGPR